MKDNIENKILQNYNHDLMIIGSKKYENLNLNKILDKFICFRCNLAIPNNLNGNNCNGAFINGHLYRNMCEQNISEENFLKYYKNFIKSDNDEKKFIEVYNKFNKVKKNFDFIINNLNAGGILKNANEYLKKNNCKLRFKKGLSIGYGGIILTLINNKNNNKIAIYGFSITSNRKTFYQNENKKPGGCHDFENEVEILKWLHENNFIDVTLCLLEDSDEKIIDCSELNPTGFMIKKLCNNYGSVTLKNYNLETIRILDSNQISYLKIDEIKLFIKNGN